MPPGIGRGLDSSRRALLGHASMEQTSTYLNVEAHGLQETMQRFDIAPEAPRCNPVAITASAEKVAEETVTGVSVKGFVD